MTTPPDPLGVAPAAPGSRACGTEPQSVSALRASIPNAEQFLALVLQHEDALEDDRSSIHFTRIAIVQAYEAVLNEMNDLREALAAVANSALDIGIERAAIAKGARAALDRKCEHQWKVTSQRLQGMWLMCTHCGATKEEAWD
jgi:hypothetical protein